MRLPTDFHVAIVSLDAAYREDHFCGDDPTAVPFAATMFVEAIYGMTYLQEASDRSRCRAYNGSVIAGDAICGPDSWAIVIRGRLPSPGDLIRTPSCPSFQHDLGPVAA